MAKNEGTILNIIQQDKPLSKELEFVDILRTFSPGTSIRSALDDILRAGMGTLIVVYKEGISNIIEGGFKVNCKFTAQRLVELAKMDGAIILSSDMKKILNANTLLIPDSKFITKETGTRHKAAERTAQQAETIVIAISERKRKITVYWKDISYVLEESSEILRKAAETLQILEKQKEIFDELLIHFNIAEITNIVVRSDICDILQRIEIIERISEKVKRYLIELGKEGVIVSMRLRELTKNLIREKEMILKDYFKLDNNVIKKIFQNMNFDILLENSNVMRIVFEDDQDHPIQPEGWRILHKTNLLEGDISLLINTLGNLENISDASKEKLFEIFKNELFTEDFIRTLDDLRNKIISGKKI